VGSDDADNSEDEPQEVIPQRDDTKKPPIHLPAAGQRCQIPMFHEVFRVQDDDLQRSHGDDLRPPSSASDNAAVGLAPEAMAQRFIAQYQKTTYAVCFLESASARSAKDGVVPPIRPARLTHASGNKACGVPYKDYLLSADGGRAAMLYCLGGRVDQEDTLLPQLFY
jgi:hypothetical protein